MSKGKPFKETKAYQIVSKVLPGLAKGVADVIPGGKLITGIINEITGSGKEISPEDLKALQDFEKECYALEVEDRKSAREREVEYIKATGHADYMVWFLSIALFIVFGFIVWSLVRGNIPQENREMATNVIGIVEGLLISIYSYYFGSSMSSRMKDMKK